MFVSLTRVCVVYVVKEVTSFPGAGPIKKRAGNSGKSCSNGNLCVQQLQLFTFVHTPGSLLLLVCLLLVWRIRKLRVLRVNEYLKRKI